MKIINTLIPIIFVLCGSVTFASEGGVAPLKDSTSLKSSEPIAIEETIEEQLDAVAKVDPMLYKEIDINVGKVSLTDLLRNIAAVSGVNISCRNTGNILVDCNFARLRVVDIVNFLCSEYDLKLEVFGNIISLYKEVPAPPKPKEPVVLFTDSLDLLSYDLSGDMLIDVTKKMVDLSGRNIMVPRRLYTNSVSGYVHELPFDQGLQHLALMNDLLLSKDSKGVFSFQEDEAMNASRAAAAPYRSRINFSENQLSIDSLGNITARIGRCNVGDIIVELCQKLEHNHFFISAINLQTSIFVRDVSFQTLLDVLLAGSDYTYYIEDGIYYFGATKGGSVASVNIIPLEFRSVEKIVELIPSHLQDGLQIKPFVDLNCVIVSGDQKKASRVRKFLKEIDKRVPLITMEIMIVDVTKSNIREVGLGAGVGTSPRQTSGSLSPGVNMQLGASSVNKLIQSFNGFGWLNLGKVSSNFYLDLQMLEENGDIKLQSTPKLSTLNGNEATLKSGETKYYKEIQNTYMGTQNPIQSESYQWKSVEANLSIKITPYVSSEQNITMEVDIEQTEFTGEPKDDEPPASVTRSFKSLVRIGNGEMVLLGGIDRNMSDKTTKGLPFITKVPVLRLIFGNRKNNQVDSKLSVFIKPTIIY